MYYITVQRAVSDSSIPKTIEFKRWIKAALEKKTSNAELTVRIVDKNEIKELNSTYRKKNKPTNVLSFPFEMPKDLEIDVPILGDIVICGEIVKEEAREQNKPEKAHWAHLVIHGTLHLLGYDHEKDSDADVMEAEEILILKSLGFSNPYQLNKGD